MSDARLSAAAGRLQSALDLLDDAGAPADIGAQIAGVISRLKQYIASQDANEVAKRTKSLRGNDGYR